MTKVAMFVYGTLRPGRDGWSWGMDGSEEVISDATIPGKLFFSLGDGGSYPVAKLDVDETIIGDIIMYSPDSYAYHHVCDVETGAGYEMREVVATTPAGGQMLVMAWHYTRSVAKKTAVPDNDWVTAVSS